IRNTSPQTAPTNTSRAHSADSQPAQQPSHQQPGPRSYSAARAVNIQNVPSFSRPMIVHINTPSPTASQATNSFAKKSMPNLRLTQSSTTSVPVYSHSIK